MFRNTCLFVGKNRNFLEKKIISVTKQEEVACDVVAEYPSYCMIYCRRSSRKVVIMSYNISNLILTGCRTIIWIFRFFLKDQEKVFLCLLHSYIWFRKWFLIFFPFMNFCIKHEKWAYDKTIQFIKVIESGVIEKR